MFGDTGQGVKGRCCIMATIRCKKCGDVITSRHTHDFVTCKCGSVSVDGGDDYLRTCYPAEPAEEWYEVVGVQGCSTL